MREAAQDQQTVAQYDVLNRTTQITDAQGHSEQFSYDAQDNVLTHTNKNGHVFTYAYDAVGNQIQETLPLTRDDGTGTQIPVVNQFAHDAYGNRVQQIEAVGLPEQRVTHYVYDKHDNLITTYLPDVQTSEYVTPTNVGSMNLVGNRSFQYEFGFTERHHNQLDEDFIERYYFDFQWDDLSVLGEGDIRVEFEFHDSPFNSVGVVSTVHAEFDSLGVSFSEYVFTEQSFVPYTNFSVSVIKEAPSGDIVLTQHSGQLNWIDNSSPYWDMASSSSVSNGVIEVFGQPAESESMRLWYWPVGDSDNIKQVDLLKVGQGQFLFPKPTELDSSTTLEYEMKAYDGNGEITNFFAGELNSLSVTMNGQPQLVAQIASPVSYQDYNAFGNLIKQTDAEGYETYHYYDQHNQRIASIDAEGYMHTFTYNPAGDVIAKRTYADVLVASIDKTTLPDLSTISGFDMTDYRETTYTYDANHQLLSESTQSVLSYQFPTEHPDQSQALTEPALGISNAALTKHYEYDANGNVVKEVDRNGHATHYYYDNTNNRIAQVNTAGYLTTWTYDANANKVQQHQYAQALNSTLLTTLTPQTDVAILQADVAGHSDDRIMTYSYDAMNRMTAETVLGADYATVDAQNGSITQHTAALTTGYDYDAMGNLIRIAHAQNQGETLYQYDALNRQIRESSPEYEDQDQIMVRKATALVYDAVGNIIQERLIGENEGHDKVTQFEYDDYGNLIRRTDAEGNVLVNYYDLNGNVVVSHTQRRNPDGTQPFAETKYSYDKLNRQIQTTDAKNFTYHANYNAHGDIVSKGLNGQDQEYFEYDLAGRLTRTNQGDGVYRAYLYDANGNMTTQIQSGITDTYLETMDYGDIALLSPTQVQRTINVYDALNQQIQVYSPPLEIRHETPPDAEGTWVEANGFVGGTLDLMQGGTISVEVYNDYNWNNESFFTLDIVLENANYGLGDGDFRLVFEDDGGYDFEMTGFRDHPNPGDVTFPYVDYYEGSNYYGDWGDTYTLRIYQQTSFGEILIATESASYSPSGGRLVSTRELTDTFTLTGVPQQARSVELWLWEDGQTKPANPVTLSRQENIAGTPIDGWFSLAREGYPAGAYQYEYKIYDGDGVELDYISGTLDLTDETLTVNTKLQYQLQTDPIVGAPVTNYIVREQSYNAFGEVIQEIDGRGYITQFVYDQRGNLISKQDPQTTVTLENGYERHEQITETRYYYDAVGRHVGTRDANDILNEQINQEQGLAYTPRYTSMIYNHAGLLKQEIYAIGARRRYEYERFGNRAYMIDASEVYYYSYDRLNQLKRIDRPTDESFGNQTRYDYYEYDEAGRRIMHRNTRGEEEYTYYDDIGRVSKTVSYGDIVTTYRYIYDDQSGGTQIITTHADGRTLSDTKNYFGRLEQHIDLGDRIYTYDYNEAGWLIEQTNNHEQHIDYTYYLNGYLKEVIDHGVNSHTKYEYDENGNRTFEGYRKADPSGGQVYYQWSDIEYDEQNRVKKVNDPKYYIQYEYDANGNRRHVYARYHDGVNNDVQHQDYWYVYDERNRFTTTKGSFSGLVVDEDGNIELDEQGRYQWDRGEGYIITAGDEGVVISYDNKGRRETANNERYVYNVENLLTKTIIRDSNGVEHLRAERTYDAFGNVSHYYEYGEHGLNPVPSNRTRFISYSYNDDNRIVEENNQLDNIVTEYFYDNTGVLDTTETTQSGAIITTDYQYEYWDIAKQRTIKTDAETTGYFSEWKPGFSDFHYDANGHLYEVNDYGVDGESGGSDDRYLRYKLDHEGKILQRDELTGLTSTKTRHYYYLNGHGIGDAGGAGAGDITSRTDYVSLLASRDNNSDSSALRRPEPTINSYQSQYIGASPVTSQGARPVASADFDYNYLPINDNYPAKTPGTYTVVSSDQTLQQVALAVWGDSTLWYLIADANGLSDSPQLIEGQVLIIPNVVTNLHNNADTFKVYNPGELLGDTSPTLPYPPPPPTQGCSTLAVIIVIVVTAVIAYYVGPEAAEYFGSKVAGAAIGAAAGSAAGQATAIALGVQDKFDWEAVGIAAATAGLTKGLDFDPTTLQGAAVNNAVSQGINILAGRQEKFSWQSMAVSSIAAPITAKLVPKGADPTKGFNQNAANLASSNTTSLTGPSWQGFANDLGRNLISETITEGLRTVVYTDHKFNWASVAGNAIGNAIGSSIQAEIQQRTRVMDYAEKRFDYLSRQRRVNQQDNTAIPHLHHVRNEPFLIFDDFESVIQQSTDFAISAERASNFAEYAELLSYRPDSDVELVRTLRKLAIDNGHVGESYQHGGNKIAGMSENEFKLRFMTYDLPSLDSMRPEDAAEAMAYLHDYKDRMLREGVRLSVELENDVDMEFDYTMLDFTTRIGNPDGFTSGKAYDLALDRSGRVIFNQEMGDIFKFYAGIEFKVGSLNAEFSTNTVQVGLGSSDQGYKIATDGDKIKIKGYGDNIEPQLSMGLGGELNSFSVKLANKFLPITIETKGPIMKFYVGKDIKITDNLSIEPKAGFEFNVQSALESIPHIRIMNIMQEQLDLQSRYFLGFSSRPRSIFDSYQYQKRINPWIDDDVNTLSYPRYI